ncbi:MULTISPECIES: YciI family protein [Streptomyces]|uniref:YCII-related domain-containing protein n=2 Tax=Streptomyces TaxID=1883 RepID=A0A646KRI7_STRJU|nr:MULTISPECIES: YciI family protein [Streptomyces]MQS34770.1 hypothetical protein [Streptomyces katsurahamanus]MQT04688.1 hypothetical protein [Streptomyces jumonjinensis]
MAKFAVLLYVPAPANPLELTPEELEGHEKFGAKLGELGGTIVDGHALLSSTEAVTIRDGVAVDGPWGDGKEVVTGFMVLEARDRDHAIEIAKHAPGAGVEVRPLFEPPAE